MSCVLRTRGAAFGYGGRAVLEDLDLEFEQGSFVGIVGPNGAGKTTLFRGLLGLIRPLRGTVEYRTEAVGYVPQRETLDGLYPLTVEEVVHMGAYGRLRGWRGVRREERELAEHNLARVGLFDRRHLLFSSLSGGQRQRALLARALMARPRLLLLDEPTSGVDRAAQARILELLRDLNSREGLAVLLVSHQLPMVREAVNEVLWVAEGRVLRGRPEELLSPESLERLYASGLEAG